MRKIILAVALLQSVNVFSQGKFFGGNGDGFAAANLVNIVLPLHSVNFNLGPNSNSVVATATVSSPAFICSVKFEKSHDGRSFDPVDSLFAPIPTGTFLFYDRKPLNGLNYYRIKMINCDGTRVYTQIIPFRWGGLQNSFFVSNRNQLQYIISRNGMLRLFSSNGQIFFRSYLYEGTGLLQLPQCLSGSYFISFEGSPANRILLF